jgi:hypothetical protein
MTNESKTFVQKGHLQEKAEEDLEAGQKGSAEALDRTVRKLFIRSYGQCTCEPDCQLHTKVIAKITEPKRPGSTEPGRPLCGKPSENPGMDFFSSADKKLRQTL